MYYIDYISKSCNWLYDVDYYVYDIILQYCTILIITTTTTIIVNSLMLSLLLLLLIDNWLIDDCIYFLHSIVATNYIILYSIA